MDDLSIDKTEVLKSSTLMVLLSISLFLIFSLYLTYWGAPMLHLYVFTIAIYIFWIDSLIIVLCPSLSFMSLCFKVYIFWYEYCYSSFLLISLCMEYLLPSPFFPSVYILRSEVGLLFTEQDAGFVCLFVLYPPSQSKPFG